MKSTLRHYAAAAIAAFGFALPASAGTTYGTDYTDLWYKPDEAGWGINLVQQYEVIFATLYVYGADNAPRWYVASDLRGSSSNFSGPLYQMTGPAFSAPWTGTPPPAPVGSMSVSFSGSNDGTLTYTINGVTVSKSIQRQPIRNNHLGGNYIGGMTATASNCSNPTDNGFALMTGLLTVQHSGGSSASLRVDFRNAAGTSATCTFNGTYTLQGRLGTIAGSYNCTLGSTGTFTMTEVDGSRNGFNATFSGQDQFCRYNGYFGGVRDVL
ncbi:MAG TPA: hypothetical protein VFK48_12365 [Usitatibacter sp.]|nr:hypothetical protein [Usitatibacter sp.]